METPNEGAVPDLLPVRMLNEFVYCPRLFHLEWVDRLFADNFETVDGRWKHRTVDAAAGGAPSSDDGDAWRRATSVELSSERLGLIGRTDIIEGRHGKVVPVEIKRGVPRAGSDPIWPPEQVQVCALGLLLRDNGYDCDGGAVFFASTRQRIDLPFTDELVEATLTAVRDARAAALRAMAPPPLEDSGKCRRCSLAGICLPDETRFLRRERLDPPRRLIPSDSAAHPLYVTDPGSYVRKDRDRVVVEKDGEVLTSARAIDVSQLCLFGNVQISTQLVSALMRRDVPVCWFSTGGWLNGITEGLPAKNVDLRRAQFRTGDDTGADGAALAIARAMVAGKIRNSRTMLRRNGSPRNTDVLRSMKRLADRSLRADNVASLLGFEGTAARLYFGQFASMLRTSDSLAGGRFDFAGRNRRPPRDAINCLLSFTYSLLVKDCVATLRSVGFDPYMGVLHRPRFGRPALALDLAEEFRPLISESVTLTAVNNGEVTPGDFITRAGGVSLTSSGRRSVLRCYERRLSSEVKHPVFGYRISYRRTIEVQARILAATLTGELPHYEPMVTR